MKSGIPKMMLHVEPHQSLANTYDMYLYDDVTARGKFDWSTWTEIESETSAKYFRNQLSQIPANATINLYINSNGGDVKEGVGIYNQLKRHGATVNGVVDGNAYSVAFLILMACDHRVMNLGTSALVHNMWMLIAGNANELRQAADDLDKLMESNRQIFLDACNYSITEEKLMELMDAETYLTPDECLEYGFIDEVNRSAEPPAEDHEEELQQLREANSQMLAQNEEMQSQIEELQQKIQELTPDPVQPMDGETVKAMVSKIFK